MARIRVYTPRILRALRRARHLVITMKGLEFAGKWYNANHIPPRIARLYQLLLKLIWMKGVMAVGLAERMGYGGKAIDQALSSGYVKIAAGPSRLPEEVQNKIVEMIGEAPREIYA